MIVRLTDQLSVRTSWTTSIHSNTNDHSGAPSLVSGNTGLENTKMKSKLRQRVTNFFSDNGGANCTAKKPILWILVWNKTNLLAEEGMWLKVEGLQSIPRTSKRLRCLQKTIKSQIKSLNDLREESSIIMEASKKRKSTPGGK